MKPATFFELGKDERVAGMPFADPSHTAYDSAVIAKILGGICKLLGRSESSGLIDGIYLETEETLGTHRYVIPRPAELLTARDVHLVGFFGQKRSGAPDNYFGNLGLRLADKVPEYAGILVYNTISLGNGDFGNVVLMADDVAKQGWLTGNTHAKAVQIAPGYYASIRIYNGRLPGGVSDPENFQLDFVKYLDYLKDPVWRAMRAL